MKYSVSVASVSDEGVEVLGNAYGSFEVANFALKAGLKEIEGGSGDFRVTFARSPEDGEEQNIVSVTGDVDVVTYISKKKVAVERKALNDSEPEPDATSASE